MELHQIRYFLALCEEQNFTRAARRCGVSQPSLSNAIKRLEQELGGSLFLRNRVNCPLSELGQEVLLHLARLDQCARDARTQAAHFMAAPRTSTAALQQVASTDKSLNRSGLESSGEPRATWRKGHEMPKLINLIGAGAFAAAAIFVWSQTTLVSSHANFASAVLLLPSPVRAVTATTGAMLPAEMDIAAIHRTIKNLPEEAVRDFAFVFPHGG